MQYDERTIIEISLDGTMLARLLACG